MVRSSVARLDHTPHEVRLGDDADQGAPLYDRQAGDLELEHHPTCFGDVAIRLHRVRYAGHDFVDQDPPQIVALNRNRQLARTGQGVPQDVALRQETDDLAIFVHHRHVPDVQLVHQIQGGDHGV